MMNIYGARLVSLGKLAAIFQRSPDVIRAAIDELNSGPYLILNEVEYYGHAIIASLRDRLSEKENHR